jgi:hypothetical protein
MEHCAGGDLGECGSRGGGEGGGAVLLR